MLKRGAKRNRESWEVSTYDENEKYHRNERGKGRPSSTSLSKEK